jgi:hypothetical protein
MILKSDVKVAFIEYKKRNSLFNFHQSYGHYMIREIIIKEIETAEYKVNKQYFFLPEKSFTIFYNKEKIKN